MIWKPLIYMWYTNFTPILWDSFRWSCGKTTSAPPMPRPQRCCKQYPQSGTRCLWKTWTNMGWLEKQHKHSRQRLNVISIYDNLWSYPCTSSTSGTSRVNIATTNTVWYQYNAPIPGIFNILPIGVLPTHLLHPVARSIDLTFFRTKGNSRL